MAKDPTIEDLRVLAEIAGLALGNYELQRLLPGVNRSKKQTAEHRECAA
jgi:hypothetical protein